jgi:hypothetical protein
MRWNFYSQPRCTLARVLVLSGYGLGLFLAAQVGPVSLLIVRSVLRGGRAFAAVLLGVGLGALTWYGGFSTAVALTRKRLGDRLLRLVDVGVGSGLIAFGGLLGCRSLHEHA